MPGRGERKWSLGLEVTKIKVPTRKKYFLSKIHRRKKPEGAKGGGEIQMQYQEYFSDYFLSQLLVKLSLKKGEWLHK